MTTNCTTSIRTQHPPNERVPWDWRMLLNGKGDELLIPTPRIVTGGLPFPELKAVPSLTPALVPPTIHPIFQN